MSKAKDEKHENAASEDGRLAYTAPAIVGEHTFETLALSCGKQSGGPPSCGPPIGVASS